MMREPAALLVALLVGFTCKAQSEEAGHGAGNEATEVEASATPDETVRERRAVTQSLWNGAFARNIVRDPKEAEADFAKVQDQIALANPSDAGDPAAGNVLFQRGYLAVEAGEHGKAIALFEELVKRFPGHAYADDALNHIGYTYQRHLRDYDRAEEAYARLAKVYADRENAIVAQYNTAQIDAQRGLIDRANWGLNRVLDNARQQRRTRGQTAVPNYYEEQSEQLLRFMESNKDAGAGSEPMQRYFQATNDLQEGRLRDATGNFSAIRERYANTPLADDAAFGLAECKRLAGRLDEAAKAYEGFLSEYPGSDIAPQARYRLAEFMRLMGNDERARALYAQVVAAASGQATPRPRSGNRQGAGPSDELKRLGSLAARRLEEIARTSQAVPAVTR